jgi:hypothetical protein
MDHSQAMASKAAEQYLLGELKGELRYQFEEHFMSCPECARDIRAGAAFVESAREVLRSKALEPARARVGADSTTSRLAMLFRPLILAPAFAILLAVVAYQSAVKIPLLESALSRAQAPSTLTSFSLINENSRGGGPKVLMAPADQPFTLYVDIPPQPSFASYNIEVQSERGTRFALTISAEEAKTTVQVLVPASRLRPGQYTLVVRGSSAPDDVHGTEVVRYPFWLQYSRSFNFPNR